MEDIEEDNEPYCIACGNDEGLKFLANYANGGLWKCPDCENEFMA